LDRFGDDLKKIHTEYFCASTASPAATITVKGKTFFEVVDLYWRKKDAFLDSPVGTPLLQKEFRLYGQLEPAQVYECAIQ
jgi:hypothetical protein